VISRRRGRIVKEFPVPGTPFSRVVAHVPALDAYGLETDLRIHSHGDAFCVQQFDHWAIVPGDPLDESIVLRPLEPSPPEHLARELVVKMRRRKGLNENVSLSNYFDEELMLELAKREAEAVGGGNGSGGGQM
jgi:U5 small nuclear ribonucleoprotein component